MAQLELSAGTIDYRDTATPNSPTILFVHGWLMDNTVWDAPIAALSDRFRCLAPTLPLGSHRYPMRPDADLSPAGLAGLVSEFMDRLDLREVILVANDTGGSLVQLVLASGNDRVARVVLASCDAFDNIPPGLTGWTIALAGRLSPALFGLFLQQLRLRLVRRLPIAYGWLTKRGDQATRDWLEPLLHQPAIRRDTVRMLRAALDNRRVLSSITDELARFDRPALIVWASQDRVMPVEHGRRLAELLPQARLVEVADSYTLLPLDQPARFSELIGEFSAA